jgi:DNA-binding MarR family transcriptional regulator
MNNVYLFHLFLKKKGFDYENFHGQKKLKFNHHLTLILLKKHKQLSMLKIREILGINKQKLTYVVDALVETGFVERLPNMNDRRVISIVLTDKGDEYLSIWKKNKIKEISVIFDYFTEEDLEKLISAIENIKSDLLNNV